jgi:hypothetical protein
MISKVQSRRDERFLELSVIPTGLSKHEVRSIAGLKPERYYVISRGDGGGRGTPHPVRWHYAPRAFSDMSLLLIVKEVTKKSSYDANSSSFKLQ